MLQTERPLRRIRIRATEAATDVASRGRTTDEELTSIEVPIMRSHGPGNQVCPIAAENILQCCNPWPSIIWTRGARIQLARSQTAAKPPFAGSMKLLSHVNGTLWRVDRLCD